MIQLDHSGSYKKAASNLDELLAPILLNKSNTILENSFESKQSETRTAQGTYKSLFQIKMVFWYNNALHISGLSRLKKSVENEIKSRIENCSISAINLKSFIELLSGSIFLRL
ncbi:MAG: hypothetical protein ACKO3R_03360 [bacterium]